MDRKNGIIIDIARLLKELGLPSAELDAHMITYRIGFYLKKDAENTKSSKSLTAGS